ncbi:hypothetical protein GPECTOR_9g636 [Gonium pectorale]|uniref:ABC transporter domain-containing protein n=1 Tax=Gonium pectorale TaxID=33097 RepID=A0A150GS19_GONPE|nr:hypothetical protein GPECTOR_9g636 [Gonium pectorale]|eukprot:KXZ52591.1 hypothetical protein GPECTOR_9g636 [Gonium pectorale]
MRDDSGGVVGPHLNGAAADADSHVAINMATVNGGATEGPHAKRVATNSNQDLKRAASNAAILRSIEKRSQILIRFEDVCAWVPTLVLPGGESKLSAMLGKLRRGNAAGSESTPKQAPPKERQILFNVSGEVHPGEVLALMGPSGGGKTSLLTLLGGRSTARLGGAITFNGQPLNKPIKRKLGYVAQDDLLYAELTVYETLYFAALLRLPRSWSRADKLARVEMVVAGLGLERCRDTIIGSAMMRGVSGGERKRVSIGHELLINPSMLLLDEPTSGLDSTTALRLMHTLRSLASGGRTIVTSIHQPSSRLYRQMDKLMLLSEGRTMYYGEAAAVSTWFRLHGQPCPFGTNVADHILDLASGDVVLGGGASVAAGLSELGGEAGAAAAEAAPASAAEVLRGLVEAYEKRSVGRGRGGIRASDLVELEEQQQGQQRQQGQGDGGDGAIGPGKEVEVAEGGGAAADDKWGASWLDQVKYLTVRSVKTRRFQSLSSQKFIQLIGVALLSGMFWWQRGPDLDSEQAVLDIGGLLFFVELFMGFASLYAALFTFPAEFQLLVKERQSGMYRLSAFYAARTLSDLPMDCLLPSLFTWIVYWMSGLRIDAGAFFACWSSVILLVLTAQSVGLLIGATVMNPQNGQTIATIFMLSTMLVGGYYVRGIPVWISWLKYASFIYWGWNLLLKVEFRHRPFGCDLITGSTDAAAGAGGESVIAAAAKLTLESGSSCQVAQAGLYQINVNEAVTLDVCILIAMLIFLRICIYYALAYKTTFKGQKK